MSGCGHSEVDHELMESALQLVLGMITARRCDNKEDARMLITGFMSEALDAGMSESMAWATLFTQSISWVDVLIECRALHHEITHQEAIQELSLAMAFEGDDE